MGKERGNRQAITIKHQAMRDHVPIWQVYSTHTLVCGRLKTSDNWWYCVFCGVTTHVAKKDAIQVKHDYLLLCNREVQVWTILKWCWFDFLPSSRCISAAVRECCM